MLDWIPQRLDDGKSESHEVIEMPTMVSSGFKSQKSRHYEPPDNEKGPDQETDAKKNEPCLNVRLLKERLELEVGLIREGIRLSAFIALCICFAIAFFQCTQPTYRAASRFFISTKLQTEKIQTAMGPGDTFAAIMEASSIMRKLVPTSSHYVDDPLGKVIIGNIQSFPSGPVDIPASRHPDLLLEWTLTARFQLEKSQTQMRRKRLLVRSYQSGDLSGLSCWAWYCMSYNHFIFEYGRNNIDDYYPSIEFLFDPYEIETDPNAFNLVAVMANSTHLTVRLQDGGEITKPLLTGTLPASCQSATVSVGDHGLQMGNLQYYPKLLQETQFVEIEQSGQTLIAMASGMAMDNPGIINEQTMSESHAKTQKLVKEYGQSNLEITKLSGTLAYLGSRFSAPSDSDAIDISELSRNSTMQTLDADLTGLEAPEQYISVIPAEEAGKTWVGTPGTKNQAAADLSSALTGLAAKSIYSFTLSWWAQSDSDPGITELIFIDAATGKFRFMAVRATEKLEDGTMSQGWIASFHFAPFCSSDEDEPCVRSPNIFCQSPDGGGYDGIWRHYAIRFEHNVNGTGLSEFEILLDGSSLCAINFEASMDFVPHNLPDKSLHIMFMSPVGITAGKEPLYLADMRVYPRALSEPEVKVLSNDPEMKQCLDLSYVSDNSEWVSEFGQTCAELASMSSSGSDSYAPGACRVLEVQKNCPVSCIHELAPLCNDGTPPVPKQNSVLGLSSRSHLAGLFIENPEAAGKQWGLSINLSEESLRALMNTSVWKGGIKNGEWYRTFNDVRKVDYGMAILTSFATANAVQMLEVQFLPYAYLWLRDRSPQSDGSCPGLGLDNATMKQGDGSGATAHNSVVRDICRTETQTWSMLTEASKGRDPRVVLHQTGWLSTEFIDGLMSHAQSFTLYYWARTNDPSNTILPGLTGIDLQNNICFAIRGTTAWMQTHGLVNRYDNSTNPGEDWRNERIGLQAPVEAESRLRHNEWNFFALSVNLERRLVKFAVNGFVVEETLPSGDWGCNGLDVLLNTGPDIDLSPVRISAWSISKGSMQNLYLQSRSNFATVISGESKPRLQRIKHTELQILPYPERILALAPPILLQRRMGNTNPDNHKCHDNEIMKRYVESVDEVFNKRCEYPYECEERKGPAFPCLVLNGESPERFFGHPRIDVGDGDFVFADLAWSMQSEVIVRDGKELRPSTDYIDSKTVDVELIIPFFAPLDKIATLIRLHFDMTGVKRNVEVEYLQLNILTWDEYLMVVGWAVAAIVLATLSIAMAFSAAVQEVKEVIAEDMPWLKNLINRFRMTVTPLSSTSLKRVYSSNTTQPDLFDVFLNVGMIGLLIGFLITQTVNYYSASEIFADIASIDWDDENISSQEKITLFLGSLKEAGTTVKVEEQFFDAAFWMLVLCCVRMIIYMKIHPRISSITETFITTFSELVNFLFSFGVIFIFLAYIAHVRFGYLYDEFSTFRASLITQFALLIGDSSPDYSKDSLMCIYIVSFIFICTLSLLNFLLAIVVNGYTQVTERVLENQVAQGVIVDICAIPYDLSLWIKNRLPAKLEILRTMQAAYPDVFDDEEEVVEGMSRGKFVEILSQSMTREEDTHASFRKFQLSKFYNEESAKSGADLIFDHYLRFHVLHLFPAEAGSKAEGATFWRRRLHPSEMSVRNADPSTRRLRAPVVSSANHHQV